MTPPSAYTVLPELEHNTPEWHAARRDSIGASEVAAILGLSKWQTPLDVYRAKKGVPNEIDPNLEYFGHALEPVIAGWIARSRPEIEWLEDGFSARSTAWPWLTASPDRIARENPHTAEIQPVEIKTSSAFVKGDWADGVPAGYQAQVQTQLAVLGSTYGWLAVLHGGNQPELYRIDRDEEWIQDYLIPETRRFWEEHVLADIPPEPITTAEAVALWPGDPDLVIDGSEDVLELWREYGRQQEAAREAEQTLEQLKLELQKSMRDASVLTFEGKPLFTWKPRKAPQRLDAAALKKERPEVAAAYMREGEPSRTFLRKPLKESA